MAKKKSKSVAQGAVPHGDPSVEDTKVLFSGTGTPYLAIFDAEGSPIMDDRNNLPIGMEVTTFHYDFLEDDDDKGEFTIETDNVNMIIHPQLEYLKPLRLQWGWLFPDAPMQVGPARMVVVKNHHAEFTAEGVTISIEFVSASFLLKMTQPALPPTDTTLLEYLKGVMEGSPVIMEVVGLKTGYEISELKVGRIQKEILPDPPPEPPKEQ